MKGCGKIRAGFRGGGRPPTHRGPPTNSIQVNQLQKIALRMHQNSPF